MPERSHERYVLKLYVTGRTASSEAAIAALRTICERDLDTQYEMEVIDVLENPQLAEHEKILATPTVVKVLPPPMRRIIGDLCNVERVVLGLDIRGPASGCAGEE